MATPAADELFDEVNDHAYAGHANRSRTVLLAKRRRKTRHQRESHPGMRLIGTGAVLLVLLGAGLLAVSYAAQYRYVLGQRHQVTASLIEAGALDVGMIIFSLIALGLALAGLAPKTERAAIIACAVASAVMNYAAADVTSPRSVLAFCMPPVFLAFVVDRVVSAARRHVLRIRDGVSPWTAAAAGAGRVLRFTGLVALYGLRFVLAPPSTAGGLRRAVLAATPLPAPPPRPRRQQLAPLPGRRTEPRVTKTALLIERVTERYGLLTLIPTDQVSQIANTLAPEVGLHPASARTALLKAVRTAGEGDGK